MLYTSSWTHCPEERNGGPERFSNLSRVSQLASDQARIQTWICPIPKPWGLPPTCCLSLWGVHSHAELQPVGISCLQSPERWAQPVLQKLELCHPSVTLCRSLAPRALVSSSVKWRDSAGCPWRLCQQHVTACPRQPLLHQELWLPALCVCQTPCSRVAADCSAQAVAQKTPEQRRGTPQVRG